MYPALRSINWTRVRSWDDLEKGIISLPTEQARGEIFEEFCQAFLTLQKDFYQAQQVWRFSDVPSQILQKLGCSTHQDEGIDGILLHHDGTITAYQAKFRTNRTDIPSQRELSTFYMVSDRADYRLIISNVEDLPRAAKARKDHGQVLIEELLDLEESFFKQLQVFISIGHLPKSPPPIPKPYQVQAIIAITEGLSAYPRGQAILACGAGKTFIGKWVVDRLRCRRILVMVPSLALVRQTLGEWHRAETQAFRYICICSDESVDALAESDEWVVQRSDLDVRVSTNATDLIQYLQRKESVPQVVFSTYQSSAVLVEALADPRLKEFQFDLVICDEAHRLAGVAGRMFNQVLNDDLIRAKMRLFMTATPKIIAPRSGAQRDAEQLVELSMDNPQTFGPVLYYFGFAQAIKEGIISDYRVVVIGVSEEEIAQIVRAGGTVQTEDKETWQAENLTHRIALGKAITTYGIKKVFTFHNRVQAAARFVDARLPDGFPRVLKRMSPGLDFSAQHISGVMSAGYRAKILRDFRMSPRGVVTNARCLGEGVNVPIVDGVFFANPRKSVIDIVQATGRALRRIPGKEMAYIIIPVLVRKNEDAEQILEGSRFQTVWKVLSAMASQDDRLEAAIRETRIKQGGGVLPVLGKNDQFGPGEMPDTRTILMGFPTHIPFSKYQSLFTLEMMEKLGERWHLRFGALKKYMKEHGEEPSYNTEYEGIKIGSWLANQRTAFKKGKLPSDHVKLLDDLGVQWSLRESSSSWHDYLFECKRFLRDEKRLPAGGEVGPFGLKVGSWLLHQRRLFKKGLLPKDRVETFKELLGASLDPIGERWERNFQAYKNYVESTGKQPQKRTIHYGHRIGNWLVQLRQKREKLSEDQIGRLQALGMRLLPVRKENWESYCQAYKEYVESEGGKPTRKTVHNNVCIGKWLETLHRQRGKLSASQIKQLEELGIRLFSPESETNAGNEKYISYENYEGWNDSYKMCLEILRLNMELGPKTIYRGREIGAWLDWQVQTYKDGRLPIDLMLRVEGILTQLSGLPLGAVREKINSQKWSNLG